MPQTFSDFVPGAKAHATATYSDEDKENFNSKAAVLMDDAAADAQVQLAFSETGCCCCCCCCPVMP